ncbi:2-hydroxyacid dehydrogenase [Salinisphaera orenii]|uniref:2-hydroxyacid dehydrogenase n=1 Tax=Salinisphaera orenii TaxID=856731 RepID=UPI0019550D49
MNRVVTIIGDHFMQPGRFAEALAARVNPDLVIRTVTLDWPDDPMRQSGDGTAESGLAEYVGTQAAVAEALVDAELALVHLAPVGEAVFKANPQLEFLGVARGGPVNVDTAAARRYDVRLVNAPGRNSTAVAEFTVGLILAATRRVAVGHHALFTDGRWRGDLYRADQAGPELRQLTVGIIGYGRIGSLLPALLAPFGARVLVCDPVVQIADDTPARQVDFDTLIAEADIVSLHARPPADHRRLLGAREITAMRHGAYLINTTRGDLVDQDALAHALGSGRLAGAALDTFDIEPLPAESPLTNLDNVVLTPHIAGASHDTVERSAAMLADEVGRYLRRDAPRNPVS